MKVYVVTMEFYGEYQGELGIFSTIEKAYELAKEYVDDVCGSTDTSLDDVYSMIDSNGRASVTQGVLNQEAVITMKQVQ